MRSAHSLLVVLVTAPDIGVARKIAKAAVGARLAACANIVPGIESHYWWQGKLDTGAEVLIIFKTTTGALPKLEKIVLENHPYDTPEIISLPIKSGNARYLKWLISSTGHPSL